MADITGIPAETLQRLEYEYNLTPEALEAISDAQLRNAIRKLDYPDRPLLRLQHERLAMLDDNGEIPPGAPERARDQLNAMRAAVAGNDLRAQIPVGEDRLPPEMTAMAPGPGLSPANAGWTRLGPGNIGGRTRSIVIDPTNSATLFAGSVGGGVWITNDSGAKWRPADDLMGNLAVCSLVMDPTNHMIMYAGTGEGFNNIGAVRGAGIFKTMDGGTSWAVLPATRPDQPPPAPVNQNFYYVNRLAIASDASVIVAGTNTGIFRSTDGGMTWKQTLLNAAIGRVAFAPGDNTKLVASGNGNDGRVFYSTDGGVVWTAGTRGSAGTGRVDLAYAKGNASIVYASVQASPSEIWKSADGGKTYTKQQAKLASGAAANFLGQQGWYDNIVWAGDPTDSNLVIVGGVDLFRSNDGGNTLAPISTWWDNRSAHADHHVIVEDPGYNGTTNTKVWFGNDGGMYFTNNVKTVGNDANPPYINGWVNRNSEFEVTQFYGVASNAATKTVVAGAQDNGTLRYTPAAGTNQWNSFEGGDGGYMAADPGDPTTFYGEYVNLDIFRNTNSGSSRAGTGYISGHYWDGAAWQWKAAPFLIPDAKAGKSGALFIAPFTMDPGNSNRLLGGGASLWETTDAKTVNTDASGPAWTSIKPSIGSFISAVTIGPADPKLIYVGYNNGRIDKSINGTTKPPVWNTVSGPIGVNRMCTCVAVDPRDSNVVYATFGGFTSGNVWKSADGGQTWDDVSRGLPEAPVRWVTIHPTDSDFVYLGTEVGVIVSDDAGAHWNPTNEGPTNCCVYQLTWMGTTLLCATHGRGVFQIDLTINNTASTVVVGDSAGDVYALNGQTGAQVHLLSVATAITSAALVVNDALFVGAGDKVRRLNAGSFTEMWSRTVGTGPVDATPVLDTSGPGISDDVLYAGTSAGWLYALDPVSGAVKWNLNVQNLSPGTTKTVVAAQVMNRWVYLSGVAGIQAVDLQKAENQLPNPVAWTNPTVASRPVLLAAGSIFVPGDAGSLLRLDARSGTSIWEYRPGSQISTAPVWVLGGICFGDSDGNLVIVNYRDGTPLASQSFQMETIEAMTADGQKLYVVTSGNNGTLSAWNVRVQQTGWALTLSWSAPLPGGVSQAPTIVGTTLYATANDGIVYAFNIAEQVPGDRNLWKFAASTSAVAAPAPVFS
jgi:outer membrane protein assembly factor BamB